MAWWEKITGTISSYFQIGLQGPRVKNNAGNIDARNAGDTAYVNVRGLDPVANNDFVTLEYFNAHNEGAAGLEYVTLTLAQATVVSTGTIPGGSVIRDAFINVTTPYNGTTPTFAITITTGGATVMATTDSDLTTNGQYDVPQVTSVGSTSTITATFAGAGVSAGAALLYIGYMTPISIN
jgi:hypothetical protein